MAQEPISQAVLERARSLIYRGIPMEQVARTVGCDRKTLYRAGLRSIRGYVK